MIDYKYLPMYVPTYIGFVKLGIGRVWDCGWVVGWRVVQLIHALTKFTVASLPHSSSSCPHTGTLSLSLSLSHTHTHTLPIYFSHSHALSLSHSFTLSHTQTTKHYLSLSHSFSLILSVSLSSSHIQTLPTYIFHKHTHKQCPSLSHSFTVSHKDYFFLSHTLSFVTFVSLLLLRFLCLVVLQLQSSHFILNKSFSFEAYHRDSATEKEMEVNRCLYEIDRYRNENNLARRLSRIEQYLTDWLSMKPDRKSTVWNQCDQMLK